MARHTDSLMIADRVSIAGIGLRQWLGRRARAALRPGSYGVGTVALSYGVLQLLESRDVPDKDAWESGEMLPWLLVGTGVTALVGTFLVFVGYARLLRRSEQNDELNDICKGIWHLVVDRLGLEMRQVGVHIWSVRGFRGSRYLARRATFIIEARRATHVTWRKGKGAIGVAWAEDEPIVANVEHLEARARTERLFSEIPPRERFGLGWRDFVRSRRYRAVLAVPLRPRGKVRGCLSVDITVDGQADSLDTLLQDEQFNNVLAVCEAVLAGKR